VAIQAVAWLPKFQTTGSRTWMKTGHPPIRVWGQRFSVGRQSHVPLTETNAAALRTDQSRMRKLTKTLFSSDFQDSQGKTSNTDPRPWPRLGFARFRKLLFKGASSAPSMTTPSQWLIKAKRRGSRALRRFGLGLRKSRRRNQRLEMEPRLAESAEAAAGGSPNLPGPN